MTYSLANAAPVSAPASGSINIDILSNHQDNGQSNLAGSQPKGPTVVNVVQESVDKRIQGYLEKGLPL